MNNALLNHRTEVAELSQIVTNNQTQNKPMYAIDVSRWGISKPFSDCENQTMYRDSLFELSKDSFVSEDEELNAPHYPNAFYESIYDY